MPAFSLTALRDSLVAATASLLLSAMLVAASAAPASAAMLAGAAS